MSRDLAGVPLEAAWRDRLDDLAASRGLPLSGDLGRLGAALREVSDAYNAGDFRFRWTPDRLAARLHFFVPRDQAKVAGALRDVPVSPAWLGSGPALELLDVGAGIGASSLGAVRFLRAAGVTRDIQITLRDVDAEALGVAREVLGALPGVRLRRDEGASPRFDLVLFVQVLVEVAAGRPEAAGDAACAALLRTAVDALAPGGLVVAVEPALLTTTRRLMRARDILAAQNTAIVAPCPHGKPCAMLANPRDWCHDDLDVDLPPWLHPLARAAGLRWQGLTFTRLVLAPTPVATPSMRVVAPLRDSRGRKERQLCGLFPDGSTLRWVDRLDKHTTPANEPFGALRRGDGVCLSPIANRVGPDTRVLLEDPTET
ncbi:hypothetical protein LBMAG42_00520 [Deltaproteobacteria bacterium]|nr:hypothetical protein LBMAG42_00520 [Deltaproteobacteria bacterium]